jgi:(p)ppGpp synthase/HD superfamily hydrolase
MNDLRAVLEAADTAARWHCHQRRKGDAEEPYINHLVEVARLVADATDGSDPDLVIAALLHDSIEDCGINAAEIGDRFGSDVAALVVAVTDDKALPKQTRKQLQIDHAPGLSARAKVLKQADKTSNLRALGASPPRGWPVERKREYIAWSRAVVAGTRGTNAWLEAEFDCAADAATAAVG